MTRLTLIQNYYYTDNARAMTYTLTYKPTDVMYVDTIDCAVQQADTILEYVRDNYSAMCSTLQQVNAILMIEEVIKEDTLEEAVVLLKQAARKAMLTTIQETEIVEKVCGWAGQGSHHQDPDLPQTYQARTVISYPYRPGRADNLWYYTVYDTYSEPYATQMYGMPVVLVVQDKERHTYTNTLGTTAEEATHALAQLQSAMIGAGMTTQQAIDRAWGTHTSAAVGYHTDDEAYYSHAEGKASYAEGCCSYATGAYKPVCIVYEEDTPTHTDTTVEEAHTTTQQEYQPPTEPPHTAHAEGIPTNIPIQDILYNRSSLIPQRDRS